MRITAGLMHFKELNEQVRSSPEIIYILTIALASVISQADCHIKR